MSETNTTAPAAPQEQAPDAKSTEGHHQADGRYIPYAGGSLGWYENSGVLKTETRNNYQFRSVIDGQMVRAKQHQRVGSHTDKRRSERKSVQQEVSAVVKTPKEEKTTRVLDISKHGVRVQYVGDDLVLKNAEKVACRFLAPGGGAALLEVTCTVVHSEKTGRTRTLWHYGLDFPELSPEQTASLEKLEKLAQ